MLNPTDLTCLAEMRSTADDAYLSASRTARQYDDFAQHCDRLARSSAYDDILEREKNRQAEIERLCRSSAYDDILEREMNRQAEIERILNPYREIERLCGLTALDRFQSGIREATALKHAFAPPIKYGFVDSILRDASAARTIADASGNAARWNTALAPPDSTRLVNTDELIGVQAAQAVFGASNWADTLSRLSGADRFAWSTISSISGIHLETSIASTISQAVAQRAALERAVRSYVDPYEIAWNAFQHQACFDSLGRAAVSLPSVTVQPSKSERTRKVPPPELDHSHSDFIDNCRVYEAVQIAAPAAEGVLRLEFHKLLSPTDALGANWVEQLLPAKRLEILQRIQKEWARKGRQVDLYRCMTLGDIASLVHEKRAWRLVQALFSRDRKEVYAAIIRISEPRHLGAHAGSGLTEDEARQALEDIRQLAIDLGNDFLLEKVDEISARLDGDPKPTLH